jgi:hypothetical protein
VRRPLTALLSTITAVSLLAGCQDDGSGGPDAAPATNVTSSSPAPTSTTPATGTEPADAPAFAGSTKRQSAPGSGGSELVLVDVRAAEAEGYDRIVLEFSGRGTPGWVVNYVDEPVLDGSGEAVALDGAAALDIYASGTTWPAPDYYTGPTQFQPEHGGDIDDIYVGGTFEGYTQVLAGIDGDRVPFRVRTLSAPARLVVDVLHGDAD